MVTAVRPRRRPASRAVPRPVDGRCRHTVPAQAGLTTGVDDAGGEPLGTAVLNTGTGRLRSGRGGLKVAVTGAAGPVGARVLTALVEAPQVSTVLALDLVRLHVEGVRSLVVDVCDPAVGTALTGVDVVIHLDPDPVLAQRPAARTGPLPTPEAETEVDPDGAGDAAAAGDAAHDELPADEDPPTEDAPQIPAGRAVRAVQTVLTAAAAANVGCAVLVTSAMVYGAGVGAGVPIPEDAPLLATPDGQALRDMLDVEHVAELAWRSHPGLQVCVVRPAALAGPGVDSAVTRYFEAPRLVTVKGEPMRWQFCHLDDLVSALVVLAVRGTGGVVTVGGTGWLSQAEVERLAGRGHVELPESLAYGTADRLHRLGLTPVPPGQLRYVTRPWVISSEALRDAGWRPRWDNADTLQVVLDGAAGHLALAWRRIGRRETATLGAASATVAVLSTAAIVGARAARRHKRR